MRTSVTALLVLSWLILSTAYAGYDVHITRTRGVSKADKTPISIQEWKELVATDKELRLVEAAEATNPKTGEVLRLEAAGLAVWTDPKEKVECYFLYHKGEITVKNPTPRVVAKMKTIAAILRARVVGDEGEGY